MLMKLTNPSYSYASSGIITVSMTAEVRAADDITILYSHGISANAHIGGNWKTGYSQPTRLP